MSLFLIHGWATTKDIWPNWLSTPNAYHYESPDYPSYAHLVKTFILHYQKQGHPLTIIGWSLGGMLALQLAAEHPDKISKLILISSTPRFTICENYNAGLPQGIIRNLARKLQKNKLQTQLDFYQLMFASSEHTNLEAFDSTLAPLLTEIEIPTLQSGLKYLSETDLRSLLPTIHTPCHILHGSNDEICPLTAGHYLRAMLPNATLTIVPGAGHIPFYTQSEYCKSYLLKTITSR